MMIVFNIWAGHIWAVTVVYKLVSLDVGCPYCLTEPSPMAARTTSWGSCSGPTCNPLANSMFELSRIAGVTGMRNCGEIPGTLDLVSAMAVVSLSLSKSFRSFKS